MKTEMSLYQTIAVKFLPPTNTKGSRYKAVCNYKSLTVFADYELSPDENAGAAAAALITDMGWDDMIYARVHTMPTCCKFDWAVSMETQ